MATEQEKSLLNRIETMESELHEMRRELSAMPAPEKLPKWVQYDDDRIFCVKCKTGDHYYFTDGTHADISDCTPVRVIDEEKWQKLEEAFGEWSDASFNDDSATTVLYRAIKQLMEEGKNET